MDFLLLIDIGNTALKWLFSPTDHFKPVKYGSIPFFSLEKELYSLRALWKEFNKPKVFYASVKPSICSYLENIFPEAKKITVKDTRNFLNIDYKSEKTLGIDRVLNALGGLDYGDSFIVASLGSATVVDLILKKTFEGGVIFLGIENHFKCLKSKTEQLPYLKLKKTFSLPGKTTEDCILAGVLMSTVYSIQSFIDAYFQMFGVNKVLLTGGYASEVFPFLKEKEKHFAITLDKFLLFKGMFKITVNLL